MSGSCVRGLGIPVACSLSLHLIHLISLLSFISTPSLISLLSPFSPLSHLSPLVPRAPLAIAPFFPRPISLAALLKRIWATIYIHRRVDRRISLMKSSVHTWAHWQAHRFDERSVEVQCAYIGAVWWGLVCKHHTRHTSLPWPLCGMRVMPRMRGAFARVDTRHRYIYIYVYEYIYIYVYMCICIYIYIYICICIYVYICIYIFIYIYTYIYIYMYIYMYINVYIYIYIYTCIYILYLHTYINICIYIWVYVHMHSSTPRQLRWLHLGYIYKNM